MKTERLGLRLNPETKVILQQLAAADGRSINNYIEWLILSAYAQSEKTAEDVRICDDV